MSNKMISYMKDVATLECQLYTQNRLKDRLEWRIKRLGIKKNFEEPKIEKSKSGDYFGLLPLSWLFGTLTWIFVFMPLFPDNFFRKLSDFWSIFYLIVPPFLIRYGVIIIPWNIITSKKDKKIEQKRFDRKMVEYKENIRLDTIRVNRELIIKEELTKQYNMVLHEMSITKNSLGTLYNVDVIHPKYRNMVAVCSFYDYLDTGRCTALTGPGGAYDVYETDLRFNRIESKLDVIITKLDEIIANQQYLGRLIKESNNTLYRIEQQNKALMNNSDEIKENTELIEYNTRCSAQSSAVMEHIMVYNTLRSR